LRLKVRKEELGTEANAAGAGPARAVERRYRLTTEKFKARVRLANRDDAQPLQRVRRKKRTEAISSLTLGG